jgi:hypothetical protein
MMFPIYEWALLDHLNPSPVYSGIKYDVRANAEAKPKLRLLVRFSHADIQLASSLHPHCLP